MDLADGVDLPFPTDSTGWAPIELSASSLSMTYSGLRPVELYKG